MTAAVFTVIMGACMLGWAIQPHLQEHGAFDIRRLVFLIGLVFVSIGGLFLLVEVAT